MARILLLIFIAFLVFLLFKGLYRRITKDDDDAQLPPATTSKGEDMVACARCGVNLPRSEAREVGGSLVCQNNPNCRS